MIEPQIDQKKELDRLSDILRQKSIELDDLISANNELCDKLENDAELDVDSATHQREAVTQNLIKIEKHLVQVLAINQELQLNLNTDRISVAAREIGTRAASLFRSFEKVVDILNDKQDKVTIELAGLQNGFNSVKSYIGTSV